MIMMGIKRIEYHTLTSTIYMYGKEENEKKILYNLHTVFHRHACLHACDESIMPT